MNYLGSPLGSTLSRAVHINDDNTARTAKASVALGRLLANALGQNGIKQVSKLKVYGSLYLAYNDRKVLFTSSDQSRYTLWSCQNECDALSYLLNNIYIRFGTKLYWQIVGIPMGTKCAPLVADLFLYCYERDYMDSRNHDNQADVIEAFNSTSRYLDDLLNIDNLYFEGWSIKFIHLNYS